MPNRVKSQQLVYGRYNTTTNVPVQVDENGVVQVGGAGGGGTSSTFGAAFPSGGTASGFKDSGGTLMQPGNLDASGNLKVNIAAGGSAGTNPSTATLSNTTGNTSSVTVLASNANRVGALFVNDADVTAYLKFGATASLTSFSRKLLPGECYELVRAAYTGKCDAIWDSNYTTGAMRVTELTA